MIQFPRAIIRQVEIERLIFLSRRRREAEDAYERGRRENRRLSISKYGFDRSSAEQRKRSAERARARREWKALRTELTLRLEDGAEVETGVHTIHIHHSARTGVWAPVEYQQLRVR